MESNRTGRLFDLLAKARRRRLWHVIADQACLAGSLAMGAVILLLVLGTEILDWYWPALVFAAGLAVAFVRVRKRIPSAYRLLQGLDSRLALHDSLSTAFYFSDPAAVRSFSEHVCQAQRLEADKMSEGVDMRVALPFRFPAAGYSTIVLLTAAATLLGVRYGVQHSLDLRPPIAGVVASFFRPAKEVAELKKEAKPPAPKDEPLAVPVKDEQRRGERGTETANAEDMREAEGQATNESGQPLREGQSPENAQELSEGADKQSGDAPGQKGDESSPPSKSGEQSKGGPQEKRQPQQKDSDLLRKMQDAFANLMAKLKIPPRAGESSRMSERGAEEPGKAAGKEGQKGREMPANTDAEGSPTADPQGSRSMEAGQQSKEGKGQGGDQVSDRPGQEQARSGAGSKDGAKDLKQQEQLDAMGKLSEILGKRAENITGEVMIEVSSGDQRLRTAYSDTKATHRAAGGEIHRDEVPLVLQPYVQRYFEEVRKAGPQGAAKPDSAQ